MIRNFRENRLSVWLLGITVWMWSGYIVEAQNIGINSTGATPDTSAGLDINFANKGLLVPRVALVATNNASPITGPATSLLVYNTTTVNDVTPGYYYNAGTPSVPLWMRLRTTVGDNNWSLTGNSGTIDGTHFIGTTDNRPVNFRVNNQKAGRIDNIGSNTSIGYRSLDVNTGINNSAFGYDALRSNTTGYNNTASGSSALFSNTAGFSNTANGSSALSSNTIGYSNTASGNSALSSNTTGNSNTASGSSALSSNTTGYLNTASGSSALSSNTTGYLNTASGSSALSSNTTGSSNTASGSFALFSNTTGGGNTASGYSALSSNTTGNANTASGSSALSSNTTGYLNTASGGYALRSNTTGYNNTASGSYALSSNTTGNLNTAIGDNSLYSNETGSHNTGLGRRANVGSNNLENATAIGANAQVNTSNSMVLGSVNGVNGATSNTRVGIGVNAPLQTLHVRGQVRIDTLLSAAATDSLLAVDANGVLKRRTIASINHSLNNWSLTGNSGTVDGTHFIGTTDNRPVNFRVNNQKAGRIDSVGSNTSIGYRSLDVNTGINNSAFGFSALRSNTTGNNNTAIGISALRSNTTGNNNTAIGISALRSNTTGYANTASGSSALSSNTTGYNNTAIGVSALFSNTTGYFNTAIGSALSSNTTGYSNTASGSYALYSNTTGYFNTASGSYALSSNTTGYNNTATGYSALTSNTTGNLNTAIGDNSLYSNETGSHNTGLGRRANVGSNNLENATAIGANAQVNTSNSMVLGSVNGVNHATSNTRVGIGVNAPLQALHVRGQVRIDTLLSAAATDSLLAVDANGVLKRRTIASINHSLNNWSLTGNSGTIDGMHFIGTTDNRPVNFRVNNQKAGRIDSVGSNTSIGYRSLDVNTGTRNSAFGYDALRSNTTGFYNTAIGCWALSSNTTGAWNTASGYSALISNTTGRYNTASGTSALYYNTTGESNTASGYSALRNNRTGSYNIASGIFALSSNRTGWYNIAIGRLALSNNMEGRFNTVVGDSALISNVTGSYNTGLGARTNLVDTNLVNATAIGAYAEVATSNSMVLGSINGVNGATSNTKVGIGVTAPRQLLHLRGATGSNAPLLLVEGTDDPESEWNPTAHFLRPDMGNNKRNMVAIGKMSSARNFGLISYYHSADGSNSNSLRFGFHSEDDILNITAQGNVGIGIVNPIYQLQLSRNSAAKPGSSAWDVASDIRLKMNIRDYKEGLSVLQSIRPVYFTYNGKAGMPQDTEIGVIAQELQQSAPYMVSEWEYNNQETGETEAYLNVNNGAMTYMLINAVKEQQDMIQKLQEENLTLLQRLEKIESLLAE